MYHAVLKSIEGQLTTRQIELSIPWHTLYFDKLMRQKKLVHVSNLSRDEGELYLGSLLIVIFAMAIVILQQNFSWTARGP
jgi:hypothetical protein